MNEKLIKAILIDKNDLELKRLEKVINEIAHIEVIGKYYDIKQAYTHIVKEKPDVVFTEMILNGMDGCLLANQISSASPATEIVFVTESTSHAVKAFETKAIDYLLKPVKQERLQNTVNRISNYYTIEQSLVIDPMICSFKSLAFKNSLSSHNTICVDWRIAKAKDLFAYLIHHREQFVSKQELINEFWPKLDLDTGVRHLYSAIYHIRKVIDKHHFPIKIITSKSNYMLKLNGMKLDADLMEDELNKFDIITENIIPRYKKLLALYTGDYFADCNYSWCKKEQRRFRKIWITHLTRLAHYYIDNKNFLEAILLYIKLQQVLPWYEQSYFMLMQLHDKLNDRNTVIIQYRSLKRMLQKKGKEVDDMIEEWYENWHKKNITYQKQKS